MTNDVILELKKEFAYYLLKMPNEPFKAALLVFGQDTGRACLAVNEWLNCDDVLTEKKRLIDEHGEDYFLATRAEVARKVYELAEKAYLTEDKLKGYKLFCDIMGYIEKPGTTINNNLNEYRVIEVVNHGTDDEWRAKLIDQQAKLISDARH